jgi:hypothetical protein
VTLKDCESEFDEFVNRMGSLNAYQGGLHASNPILPVPASGAFAKTKQPFGQSNHVGWCGTIRHVNLKAELPVLRAGPRLPKVHLNVVYSIRFAQHGPESTATCL